MGVWVDKRSVSPVIATILMVAVVVVIAASIGSVAFGFTEKLGGTDVAASDGQCLQTVNFDPNNVDGFAYQATADLDCVMWFDASQETYDTNDNVNVWADRSGNGFDATSSSETFVTDPQFQENIDGLSAIQFDSSSGDTGLSTESTASEVGLDGDQPFTLSTVVRPDTDSDGATLHFGIADASNDYTGYATQPDLANDQWLFQAIGDDFSQIIYDGSGDDERWFVKTYVYDGDSMSIYKNGEPITDDIISQTNANNVELNISDTPFNIGFFNFQPGIDENAGFDGAIAEMIIIDEAFSDQDRKVLECAMAKKHGKSVTVDHCS